MKRSMLFATLILIFGIAVGCSDSKKSAGAAPPPTQPPPEGCPQGTVWNASQGACLAPDNSGSFQLFANLNITNNKQWAYFLDDYFFMTGPGRSVCGVEYSWEFYPIGYNDCETYTQNRTISLNLSSLLIHDDGSVQGNLYLTAKSSWGTYTYSLFLPVTTSSVSVSRIAINDVPDSGFQMQMTLSGRKGPKIFRLRGNSIDLVTDNGADVEIFYGDPGNMKKIGSASLYFN